MLYSKFLCQFFHFDVLWVLMELVEIQNIAAIWNLPENIEGWVLLFSGFLKI